MTILTPLQPALARPWARIDRKWLVLIATSLGVFMSSLDLTIVNVAFPAIRHSFPGTSAAHLSWVLNAYTIAFAALLIVAGRTADRIGRRRVFFTGLAVFTLGSVLCGFAPSVPALIGGRVVQGAGGAMMIPASLGLLLSGFPARQRSTAVALWGSIAALATATGPSLGAALVEGPGWRWAFFINVPVALFAWAIGRRVLTEAKDETAAATRDVIGVLLITISMGALALGIVQGRDWGWGSARIVASFATAALVVAVFAWRGLRHPDPVVDLRLFKVRSFAVANVTMVLYASGFFALLLANVLFLTSVWHYSVLRAGLAITPAPVTAALVAPFAGRLAARIGYRPLIVFGNLVTAATIFWLALAIGTTPDYLGTWLPTAIAVGFGVGASFPLISGAAVSALPPARFALASAVNQTGRQLGSIIGVAVLIAILGTPATAEAAVDGFRHAYFFSAGAALLAGTAALMLGRRPAAVAAAAQSAAPSVVQTAETALADAAS